MVWFYIIFAKLYSNHRFSLQTCLHIAADHGALENIRLLLDYGADLLAKDANGLTPLDRADQGQHLHCMDLLKHAAGEYAVNF